MEMVRVEDRGEVAVLRLENGVTNAIGVTLIDQLQATIKAIGNRYRAVVLAGNPKFFSIGLDLPHLITLTRSEMTDFWNRFNQTAFDLYTLALPTVCAAAGHVIAGGCVFATTCDYRLAASGKLKIGLNEVLIGVPVPYLTDMILREMVGERFATHMLYRGQFVSVDEARNRGLVDDVFPAQTVEDEAIKLAQTLAELPQPAFSTIKANRIEAIRSRYERDHRAKNDLFLDCWFDDSVQKLLKKACEAF